MPSIYLNHWTWAQLTADASDTTVHKDALMMSWKISDAYLQSWITCSTE